MYSSTSVCQGQTQTEPLVHGFAFHGGEDVFLLGNPQRFVTLTSSDVLACALVPGRPPLTALGLPSIFPSIRVFLESGLQIRWPECWSFSFSISPSIEYSGLISFRMDWLDLLAVQETLKSLLQHHSSKASIFQLSFLYSPTLTSIHDHWKNHSFD